jgi:predicted AAA+ superfamily ATPase
MAVSNRDRVARGFDTLREALIPFVERELKRAHGASWQKVLDQSDRSGPLPRRPDTSIAWDSQRLFKVIRDNWRSTFSRELSGAAEGFVRELLDARNRHAHEEPWTSDDVSRVLDTMQRLAQDIGAKPPAEALYQQRQDLTRTVLAEQARNQTRYATLNLDQATPPGLKPWREVVTPHRDVATGQFVVAEFAANLVQVANETAASEYGEGHEFFARTFLTTGLKRLLVDAAKRLAGIAGEPVVNLQTGFGGGKTHAMIALWHMVRSQDAAALPGMSDVLADAGITTLPRCGAVALVGTDLSPGQPTRKPDGTVVRTMWGELAWRLGAAKSGILSSGAEAFALLAESDARSTNPGQEVLRSLLEMAAPCLILVDEWVAFARQMYFRSDLPAGDFGANMSFAQALTEVVSGAKGVLLVASLPQSDIEIGGIGGQQALKELANFIRRIDNPWTPATPTEGYEIVRRRLFEPINGRDKIAARAATVKAFQDLYSKNSPDFPTGSVERAFADLMTSCYPVHPALFTTLYERWATLPTFQLTRGVLRLMANVIHVLWTSDDRGLMILPAHVPLDGPVAGRLLPYLGDGWGAVLEKDVDGPGSTALIVDRENPALQRYSAARRVARATFLASAPTAVADSNANHGVDEAEIRLGSVQPGETGATFGDALRKLADRGVYIYKDGPRHWFNTQPNVNRLAEERAEHYQDEDIDDALVALLRDHVAKAGKSGFAEVYTCPHGTGGIEDLAEVCLVILGPEAAQAGKSADSAAVRAATKVLGERGTAQRVHQNALVFLAPDAARLVDLKNRMRALKAWTSIWDEREALNLDTFQKRTAENRLKEATRTVDAQLPECWQWLLEPNQPVATDPTLAWAPLRLTGADSLPQRAMKKLGAEEKVITNYGRQRLQGDIEKFGLWGDGPHVRTRTLWGYFARYPYLPRLRDASVLGEAISKGFDLAVDAWGYAAEVTDDGRYVDLVCTGGRAEVNANSVLVKPDVAKAILAQQANTQGTGQPGMSEPAQPAGITAIGGTQVVAPEPGPKPPTRYFATAEIGADRAMRDFGNIADAVLAHLITQRGARVRVRLEIDAELPSGFTPEVIRVVTEHANTLKFTQQGFERED